MIFTLNEKLLIRDSLRDSMVSLLEIQERILEDVLESKETQEKTLLNKNLEDIVKTKYEVNGLLDKFSLDVSSELNNSEIFIIDLDL